MDLKNCYEDETRANAYAELEFPGTYHLAYRDLPQIILQHVTGKEALDFGCGTGRSTRFIHQLNFNTTGVDISREMLLKAMNRDTNINYQLISPGDLSAFPEQSFDLISSIFTFDNIPDNASKLHNLKALSRLLKPSGRILHLVSAPHIYCHEWASFTTKAFPENKKAKCGDRVKIIMTDSQDSRPVEDVLCTHKTYKNLFKKAGLSIETYYDPTGKKNEDIPWKSELTLAPWRIYVLKKSEPWSFAFATMPANYLHRL